MINGSECRVGGEVVPDRDDNIVVRKHHQKSKEQVGGRDKNRGRGVTQSLRLVTVEQFEHCDSIDGENQCSQPTGGPNQNRREQQQGNDAKQVYSIACQEGLQYLLARQADQPKKYGCENRLRGQQNPEGYAERDPIEFEWKIFKAQNWHQGQSQQQTDPVVPVAELHRRMRCHIEGERLGRNIHAELGRPASMAEVLSSRFRSSTTASMGR